MIGIILLIISLGLYFEPSKRYLSYFLYLSFMMGSGGGFGLWIDHIIGLKNSDCAVIYTFLISLYLLAEGKWRIPRIRGRGILTAFITFLIFSIFFSYLYYGLSPVQILQGGRSFLLIFSLPILVQAEPEEVRKVVRMLFWICLVTSVLYILQALVVKGPVMPYPGDVTTDRTTGLVRMYNIPANLTVFLALSFLCPEFLPKKVNLNMVRGILFIALICTLGRTGIAAGLLLVMLALLLNGSFKRIGAALIVIGILFIPFVGTMSKRFEGGNTSDDLEQVLNGKFNENYENQGDATMLYRFAWCYERGNYLVHRPLGEQLFGMGLCSDSQDWVYKHYNFKLGLPNEENMLPVQLNTPDIAIGNMITKLGFGGTIIYLAFYISLVLFFWKYRKCNVLFLLMSAYSIILMIELFSGSALSEVKTLSLMFFIMSLAFHPYGEGLMAFDASKAK